MHAYKLNSIVLNREMVPEKANTKINYMLRERARGGTTAHWPLGSNCLGFQFNNFEVERA